MTATTLNRALERVGFNGKGSIAFAAHGFRATASMLNEAGYRPAVIERQLAHKERNKVRASSGTGSGTANPGDLGQVTATLNGRVFFQRSGVFTSLLQFLGSGAASVTLQPGAKPFHCAR